MANYNGSAVLTLDGFKTAMTRVKTETLAAISKSGHAQYKKVDAVPEPDAAKENVLYLVKNTGTNHYDIYAKIDGAMELLDDTTVSLDDYVTEEALAEALAEALKNVGGGALYEGTKTDLEAADSTVIEAYFAEHSDVTPKAGDVFVVTTIVSEVTYEQSAYRYDGADWAAMTGAVDASKVMLRDDIILAGNYTQVGNITKSANGTSTLPAKGKSVAAVLTDILSKRLQPTITAQPSISGFALTGAKAVEAGTSLATANYTAATLNPGSYQYGPETGVEASNWKVERITDQGTEQVASEDAASLTAGTDNNGGAGFQIGDKGGEGVVNSLKYKLTVTHGAGVTADDNLGDDSSPAVSITAGSKTKETSAYTPFRNVFYGASTTKPTLDSAAIRALTPTGKAYAAGSLTINVPAGAQRVVIACDATKTGVTKVINQTAMNADVTATFTKSTVDVEGAEGYTAINYNVWCFEPAVPYENTATLVVTLVQERRSKSWAVNNTTGSFASMEFPMAFSRQDSFPLDKSSVYGSCLMRRPMPRPAPLPTSGQVISVVVDGTATIYQIKNTAGDLEALASGDFEGNVEAVLATQIASDTEVTEMPQ